MQREEGVVAAIMENIVGENLISNMSSNVSARTEVASTRSCIWYSIKMNMMGEWWIGCG